MLLQICRAQFRREDLVLKGSLVFLLVCHPASLQGTLSARYKRQRKPNDWFEELGGSEFRFGT